MSDRITPGLVIVEGSDAVGKTTRIKAALATWAQGGRYLHCTRKNSPEAIQAHQLRMFLVAVRYVLQGRWAFIDRWWPSDIVYSLAFGRKPASLTNCEFLDNLFSDLKLGGYIFCYDSDPRKTIERHAQTSTMRAEMYSNIERVAEHYSAFAQGQAPIGHMHRYYQNTSPIRVMQPFSDDAPEETFRKLCMEVTAEADSNAITNLAKFLKLT